MENQKIMDSYKEIIYYFKNTHKDQDGFCGYPFGIDGICGQGETLEELKADIKRTCIDVLEHKLILLQQDDPFELIEAPDLDTWLYQEREAKLRKELERYKEKYGELND